MSIKDRIKSTWHKITGKSDDCNGDGCVIIPPDSELAADRVIRKEVYPTPTITDSHKKSKCKKCGAKRSRPTNSDYQMIDPSCDTCDTSKS